VKSVSTTSLLHDVTALPSSRVNSARSLRCLLISRPAVAAYPPAISQADLLAQEGYEVVVADTGTENEFRAALPDERILYRALLPAVTSGGLGQRVQRMLAFRRAVFRLVRALRPALTIAYDAEACAAVRHAPRRGGGLLAWHFHEMWEPGGNSFSTNLALRYTRRNISQPDILIIPDRQRASILVQETGFPDSRVFVVMNCPRLNRATAAELRVGQPKTRLVVYNGSVGPNHGLETAIQSLVHWPGDSQFVIKGNARPNYEEKLRKLSREIGVSDRVIRLPFSPGFVAAYARAQIGWTVLEPVSQNWTYSAGASNKRFECMAAGIPQITDDTEDVKSLITKVGCGLCIPPLSVEGAASAVNRLLADDTLRAVMGKQGRNAHTGEFNYEAQFEPVLAWLRAATLREPRDASGQQSDEVQ
jgi:glycosyltransferase involved in cell wall biosynthesis